MTLNEPCLHYGYGNAKQMSNITRVAKIKMYRKWVVIFQLVLYLQLYIARGGLYVTYLFNTGHDINCYHAARITKL